jgi:Domain of unknown function DUF11
MQRVFLLAVAVFASSVCSASSATTTYVKGCAQGRVAVVVAGERLCQPAADLQVRFIDFSRVARVGGSVTYSLTISNAGLRRAKNVRLSMNSRAEVVSVSSRGVSCDSPAVFPLTCSAPVLAPHSNASVEVAARATRLGLIAADLKARSATREATPRNNSTTVRTFVLLPDSVHAAGSWFLEGRPEFPVRFTIDAISAALGQDAAGSFSQQDWLGVEVSGQVVCLTVSGNRATVGGVVEHSNSPSGAKGFLFFLADNGPPGAGSDTATELGVAEPAKDHCPEPPEAGGSPLNDGDIVIIDRGFECPLPHSVGARTQRPGRMTASAGISQGGTFRAGPQPSRPQKDC